MRFQLLLLALLMNVVFVTLILHKLIPRAIIVGEISTLKEQLPPNSTHLNQTINHNAKLNVVKMQIIRSGFQTTNSNSTNNDDSDSISVIDNSTIYSTSREQTTRRKQELSNLIECNKIIRRELDIASCNETNPNDCHRSYNVYFPRIVCENDKGSREAIVGTLPLVFVVHCYRCNSQL